MKKIQIISVLIAMILVMLAGCDSGAKMHKSKILNEQGLPKMVHQISHDARGKNIIDITPEISYPGMENYAGQQYEFVSKDAPQTVSDWFESNVSGATSTKSQAEEETDSFWKIKYQDLTIVLYYYNNSQCIIKYKKDLK